MGIRVFTPALIVSGELIQSLINGSGYIQNEMAGTPWSVPGVEKNPGIRMTKWPKNRLSGAIIPFNLFPIR
jgi:hypothetical protein